MSSPLSNSIACFNDIIRNGNSSKSADRVCEYLCLVIVMLTRARAGIIWIENDTHHPLLKSILESQYKCIKVCSISDIKDAAKILIESRKDSTDDDETCTGMFSAIRMISKVINVITERIESFQAIESQCITISDILLRISHISATEQESSIASNTNTSAEVIDICRTSIPVIGRLPEAILRIQLLKAPDAFDIENVKIFGDLMLSCFLDTVKDIDPEASPSLPMLRSQCQSLAIKFGKK